MRGNEFKEQAANWLLRGAQDGRVSRRRFMEGTLALGMSVSAASALWSRRVEAATPKQGGTYRVAVHEGSTTDQLDPGTTESVYMIQMNHAFRS